MLLPSTAAASTQIFVNFDGGRLTQGDDDSRIDQTSLGTLTGEFPEYGSGAKREAVLQAVREDWAAYDVHVTSARPWAGDYVMCMVGPSDAYSSTTLGIAPLDCDDRSTPNNVVFAFHSANDEHAATATATTIGQEVAHSFGLEHAGESGDIMHPINKGGDASFRDGCEPLSDEPLCPDQHERHCDRSDYQNAHAELLDRLGAAEEGTGLELIAPADGERFELDETVEVLAEPPEGFVATRMMLFVAGEPTGVDEDEPFGWTTSNLAAGTYEMRVEAVDPEGRVVASDTVEIEVGAGASAVEEEHVLPPSRQYISNEGPSCRVAGSPHWFAFFVPFAVRRRRR